MKSLGNTSYPNHGLKLQSVNTYTGPMVVTKGFISLGVSGSIDNSSLISIGAGATFDVSAKMPAH